MEHETFDMDSPRIDTLCRMVHTLIQGEPWIQALEVAGLDDGGTRFTVLGTLCPNCKEPHIAVEEHEPTIWDKDESDERMDIQ